LAGPFELANGQIMETLVEPIASVELNSTVRMFDWLRKGENPTLIVEVSEVAR
jgi:hypothetical protein